MTEEAEKVVLENLGEMTREEILEKIKDAMRLEKLVISVGEKRPSKVGKYSPNDYHYSAPLNIEGMPQIISSIVNPDIRKEMAQEAIEILVKKSRSITFFLKQLMHYEQVLDGVPGNAITLRKEEIPVLEEVIRNANEDIAEGTEL